MPRRSKKTREEEEELVMNRQKRYDLYSSVTDPAHPLLGALFGQEYADDFVFDVLFPLSNGTPCASQ
jgi:hypothetical protein